MKPIEMVMEVELLEGRAPKWYRFPITADRPGKFATAEWVAPADETLVKLVEIINSEGANCPHVDIFASPPARRVVVFMLYDDAPDDAEVVG